MTCPRCYGGAVVPTPMRGAVEVSLYTCSGCGLRWSDEPCGTRACVHRGTGKCVDCQAYRCDRHGGRDRVCDACRRRLREIMRSAHPKRGGSWERTGRLHQ